MERDCNKNYSMLWGRLGKVANGVACLMSDEASYITGFDLILRLWADSNSIYFELSIDRVYR